MEQQQADYEDEMQQKLECEMCAGSKWKSACPECDGTGYYTLESAMTEKLKYWWSEDRQFFCIRIKGETVSLTVEEAEALMSEVMQTPAFLKLQEEAWERAKQLMNERAGKITDDELFTIQCAVENLRSADKTDDRVEAAWRIASNLDALAKRISQQKAP